MFSHTLSSVARRVLACTPLQLCDRCSESMVFVGSNLSFMKREISGSAYASHI
jgi:hypothetical protein